MAESIITTGNTALKALKAIHATSADSATKLVTPRTIQVNLGSTSSASFDGSANITPGVTGVLPVSKGGTGYTSLYSLKTTLDSYGSSGGQCAHGSYNGNGTSSVSISAGFAPGLLIVSSASFGSTAGYSDDYYDPNEILFFFYTGQTVGFTTSTSNREYSELTASLGSTIRLRMTVVGDDSGTALRSFNYSNTSYHWVAIGR